MKYGFFWISSKIITLGMIMKFFFMAPANFSASTQPPLTPKEKKNSWCVQKCPEIGKNRKEISGCWWLYQKFLVFFLHFWGENRPKVKKVGPKQKKQH